MGTNNQTVVLSLFRFKVLRLTFMTRRIFSGKPLLIAFGAVLLSSGLGLGVVQLGDGNIAVAAQNASDAIADFVGRSPGERGATLALKGKGPLGTSGGDFGGRRGTNQPRTW